jgi:hypothetical protein
MFQCGPVNVLCPALKLTKLHNVHIESMSTQGKTSSISFVGRQGLKRENAEELREKTCALFRVFPKKKLGEERKTAWTRTQVLAREPTKGN